MYYIRSFFIVCITFVIGTFFVMDKFVDTGTCLIALIFKDGVPIFWMVLNFVEFILIFEI